MGAEPQTAASLAPRILGELHGTWAIERSRMLALRQSLRAALAGEVLADWGQPAPATPPYRTDGGIALIPVTGVLMKGDSWLTRCGYGTSTTAIQAALQAALADNAVTGVMLVVDSGGGSTAGVADCADAVRLARKVKPVYAYVEDCACSAAYWIASQAQQIWANRAGWVGSIGTYMVLVDSSKGAAELWGETVEIIASGQYKGPVDGAPVTDAHRENYRSIVESMAGLFTDAVSQRMPVARARELSDGRVLVGEAALAAGLVDQIGSMKGALRALRKERTMTQTAAAAEAANGQAIEAVRAELATAQAALTTEREARAGLEARIAQLERPVPADPLEALAATATPEQQAALAALRREATEREAEAARLRADQQTAAFRARAEALGSETGGLRLPTTAEALGGILQRASANALTEGDRTELERLLRAGNNALAAGPLKALGSSGDKTTGGDPVAEVKAQAVALMAQNPGLSEAGAQAKVLAQDPSLYERYTQATQVKV
jgi:signal peptide peptidase SppA